MLCVYCSGLGKASLVVCVSQAPYLFDESVHVLKFASIASRVTVEQFKEPPPPPPAASRASRFSSMLAGGGGKNSLLSSMLSGRGSIAWEEPRSRSTMLPECFASTAKAAGGGRPIPLRLRSTICPPTAAASTVNLSEVNEEEGEEGDSTTEQDTTVVESEQVGKFVGEMVRYFGKKHEKMKKGKK
jgi:hypothetical protein